MINIFNVMRLLLFLLLFLPILTYAQNCPEFKVKVTDTDLTNEQLGSIEITLIGGDNNPSAENFDLRQKSKEVSGPLDFEYDTKIESNKIIFSRLVKSDQLLLKHYVVRFSQKACRNGELVEVGIFQIK